MRTNGSGAGRGDQPYASSNRPTTPKPSGNPLDELTGPTMPEGNPIVDRPAARQKFF